MMQGCDINVEVPTHWGGGGGGGRGGRGGTEHAGPEGQRVALLAMAATATSESLMALLLDNEHARPPDVDGADGEILRCCAERGMVLTVRTLLHRGADPNRCVRPYPRTISLAQRARRG